MVSICRAILFTSWRDVEARALTRPCVDFDSSAINHYVHLLLVILGTLIEILFRHSLQQTLVDLIDLILQNISQGVFGQTFQ